MRHKAYKMDGEKMESIFQFSNPALLKLDFKINNSFCSNDGEEIKLTLKVETRINREKNAEEALVVLCVNIGETTASSPFYVYAEESANFKWQRGAYDEEAINRLLKQNAPALLLSYLRPIIANITGASPYSAYNIPFMNFRESQ